MRRKHGRTKLGCAPRSADLQIGVLLARVLAELEFGAPRGGLAEPVLGAPTDFRCVVRGRSAGGGAGFGNDFERGPVGEFVGPAVGGVLEADLDFLAGERCEVGNE